VELTSRRALEKRLPLIRCECQNGAVGLARVSHRHPAAIRKRRDAYAPPAVAVAAHDELQRCGHSYLAYTCSGLSKSGSCIIQRPSTTEAVEQADEWLLLCAERQATPKAGCWAAITFCKRPLPSAQWRFRMRRGVGHRGPDDSDRRRTDRRRHRSSAGQRPRLDGTHDAP